MAPATGSCRNSRISTRISPARDSSVHRLYFPKVICSPTPIQRNTRPFTLPMTIRDLETSKCSSPDFIGVRTVLLATAVSLQMILRDVRNRNCERFSRWDFFHPISCLALVLQQLGVFGDSDIVQLENQLDEWKDAARCVPIYSREHQLLQAINDFISQEGWNYPDGFYPLLDLAKFINEIDTINAENPQTLSRFLNRLGLISPEDSKRQRIYGTTRGKFATAAQVTSVRINQQKLSRLLYSRTTTEGVLSC